MFSSFSVSTTEQNKSEYHQYQQTSAAIKRERVVNSQQCCIEQRQTLPYKAIGRGAKQAQQKNKKSNPVEMTFSPRTKESGKRERTHTDSWSKARQNTADIYNHIQRKRSHTHTRTHKFTRDTTPLTATRMRWEERTIARGSKQAHASAPFDNPDILCLQLCFCETTKTMETNNQN